METPKPSVAILIPVCNENPEIVRETIEHCTRVEYENKKIYVIENSKDIEIKLQMISEIKEYRIFIIDIDNLGSKASALNHVLPNIHSEYVVLLDADQRPDPHFLEEVIPVIDGDSELAFIQTPELYTNYDATVISASAAQQQAFFYEYPCEGKSVINAAFCSGTNVIFRKKALMDVGGFDNTTITEDLATSLQLHLKGWKSLYYNKAYVRGLIPENLAAYYTQQMRWATGTVTVFRQAVKQLICSPFSMTLSQWREYLVSTSYHFLGWAIFIIMLYPVMVLLFDVRPIYHPGYLLENIPISSVFPLAFFLIYYYVAFNLYYSVRRRGYSMRDLWRGQVLGLNTFPIYLAASIQGLLGLGKTFKVTPKGKAASISPLLLLPQFIMFVLNVLAALQGIRSVTTMESGYHPLLFMYIIWATYHAVVLSSILVYDDRWLAWGKIVKRVRRVREKL